MSRAKNQSSVIGWREWITLPGVCDTPMKVKVDTGAATSALHAFGLEIVHLDGTPHARFEVHPMQRSRKHSQEVEVPVVAFRRVRSSSGHSERRPVVRVLINIGGRRFETDVTLTSRDEMGFRMLLGRSALRRRYLVDAARSYVQSSSLSKDKK